VGVWGTEKMFHSTKEKTGQIKSWILPALPRLAATTHTRQKSQKDTVAENKAEFQCLNMLGGIPKHDNIMKGQYWNGF